jgi:hypothetical protein
MRIAFGRTLCRQVRVVLRWDRRFAVQLRVTTAWLIARGAMQDVADSARSVSVKHRFYHVPASNTADSLAMKEWTPPSFAHPHKGTLHKRWLACVRANEHRAGTL